MLTLFLRNRPFLILGSDGRNMEVLSGLSLLKQLVLEYRLGVTVFTGVICEVIKKPTSLLLFLVSTTRFLGVVESDS